MESDTRAVMQGDPDPVAWVRVSAIHWGVAAIAVAYLLLTNKEQWEEFEEHHHKSKKG